MITRHPNHKTGTDQSVHGRKGAGSTKGLHEPDGGFTIDTGGRAIRTGWSVAVEGTSRFMSAEQFEADRQGRKEFVAGFLRDARGQGVRAIGGWHDPDPDSPGKAIVLDHVRIFPSEQHDLARAFAVANNQKSMANLDAIAAGDWDNAIEDTGGTGDRGSVLVHGEDTAHHGRVRRPAGRDGRRPDRHPGRGDRRRHGRQPGFVDLEATYGLILRHPNHQTGTDQSVHAGGRGGLKPLTGMDELSPELQGKVRKQIEKLYGVPYAEAEKEIVANLVAHAEAGDLANAAWYQEAHDWAAEVGGDDFTVEQVAGMAAATSSKLKWSRNKKVVEELVDVLKKDDEFDVTQKMIDDYNGYVGRRKRQVPGFDPIELAPGKHRPSDVPAGFLIGQHPGMPKVQNGENMLRAVRIARGEPVGNVLKGPKHRSFITNINTPKDPSTSTMDTWHYVASTDSRLFSGRVKGTDIVAEHTIAEWNSSEFMGKTYGLTGKAAEKAVRSPQDFFQGPPSSVADNYDGNGVYPFFVTATAKATAQFNQGHGTSLIPDEFQAVVWKEVRPDD